MTIDEILIIWYIIDNKTRLIQEDLTMKNVQERFDVLRSMNTIIKSMNDESAYTAWIHIIPDEADDDELMEIAEEDEESFEDAVRAFMEIMNKRLKYGLYIDSTLYVDGKIYRDSE